MNLTPAEIRRILLRLLFWLPILLLSSWQFGKNYTEFFLPLYRLILDDVLTNFSVLSLEIGFTHELVFQTRVIADHVMMVEGRLLPSGFTVNASTPMYIALVHPLILATSALIWPNLSWRSRLLRLLTSLPCLLLLEILDTPLVLASAIDDLLNFNVNPVAYQADPLIAWVHVMDGGGRFALALAAALLAAEIHASVIRYWHMARSPLRS